MLTPSIKPNFAINVIDGVVKSVMPIKPSSITHAKQNDDLTCRRFKRFCALFNTNRIKIIIKKIAKWSPTEKLFFLLLEAIVCLVDLVFWTVFFHTLHIHSTFVILLGKIDHKVRENFSSDFYVSTCSMQNFTPPILCNNEREHQQPHLRTKNYHTRNHIFEVFRFQRVSNGTKKFHQAEKIH